MTTTPFREHQPARAQRLMAPLLLLLLLLLVASPHLFAQAPPAAFSRNITNGSTTLTVDFTLHSIRNSTFNVQVQDASGALTSYAAGPARTYLGTVASRPGALAAGYLRPDGTALYHIIFEDGVAWNGSGTTASTAGSASWTPSNFPTTGVGSGGAGSNVYAAELGIDASYNLYTAAGSTVDGTLEIVEFSVMKTNAVYLRDAAIVHRLGRVVVRSSSANNPYSSTSTSVLLPAVRDQWNSILPASTHDLAAVIRPGAGGGLAYVGVIGTSSRYSANGAGSNGDFTSVWRHEAGHNWGSSHYEGGGKPEGPTIMSDNSLSRFSTPELAKIIAHRNAKTSILNNLGNYTFPIPPRAMGDRAWRGSTVAPVTIDVLANDSDSNGQSLTILSFDATSSRGASITRSVGTGPGGRDQLIYTPASLSLNFDHFNYRIQDSAGKQGLAKVYVSPSRVELFQHFSYGGWKAAFGVGNYTQAQMVAAGAVNDDASSIRVPAGYKVTLYTGDNFTGTSVVYTADDTGFDLAFNDAVSSMKVEVMSAELYQHGNYGGWKATLPVGNYNLAALIAAGGVNDDASSIKVPAGLKVTLYTNDNFTGTAVIKTADDADLLGDGINDAVTSVKVEFN